MGCSSATSPLLPHQEPRIGALQRALGSQLKGTIEMPVTEHIPNHYTNEFWMPRVKVSLVFTSPGTAGCSSPASRARKTGKARKTTPKRGVTPLTATLHLHRGVHCTHWPSCRENTGMWRLEWRDRGGQKAGFILLDPRACQFCPRAAQGTTSPRWLWKAFQKETILRE